MRDYKCSVCKTEYKGSWWSIKKFKQPNGATLEYLRCPKDGGIAYEYLPIKIATIGEAIIGGESFIIGGGH